MWCKRAVLKAKANQTKQTYLYQQTPAIIRPTSPATLHAVTIAET